MDTKQAQADLARAFAGGAPGVFISGAAWLIAGLVWSARGIPAGFLTLAVGGMLIMPLSVVLSRSLFGAARVTSGNALERLGLEITFPLMGGILISYVLLKSAPDLVFPVMAATIGTRYFAFRTLYGEAGYWVLGGAICGAATLGLLGLKLALGNLALLVGLVELIGSAVLLAQWRRRG